METGTPENGTHEPVSTTPSSENPSRNSFLRGAFEWAKVIVIALIIAIPIRFFIAEPFVVNGASMDPTFATGQFLIVDRLTFDFEKPQRGDVIVFRYPGDPSIYYIKRVIGLPGETVIVKDGIVSIKEASSSTAVTLNEPYIAPSNASHDTNTYGPLGPTQYFVMGDNRAESSDSRSWGPLDQSFIVGKPALRLLPISTLSVEPGSTHDAP